MPRHEWVAHLGKLSSTEAQQVHRWSELDSLLEVQPPAQQLTLGAAAPPPPSALLWRTVNLGGLCVERGRQFGGVYLAVALWGTLEPWMASKGVGNCAGLMWKA